MTHITSSLTVDAPVERIWEILTDVESYRLWNPFIVRGGGTLGEGELLDLVVDLPWGPYRRRAEVVTVRRPYGCALRGRWGRCALLAWRCSLLLQLHAPAGPRFVQSVEFTGLLSPVVSRLLGAAIRQRQTEMGCALKRRAAALGAGVRDSGVLVGEVVRTAARREQAAVTR